MHRMRNRAISETELVRQAIERIQTSLPPRWSLAAQLEPVVQEQHLDALLTIHEPSGTSIQLCIEAKYRVEPKTVGDIVQHIRQFPGRSHLLVAPFLSSRTRELLRQAGLSHADSTGNLWIALENPALWVERVGARENPWHEPRPLQSLKGGKAGRAVRAFCDFRPPYGVRELAERSQTTPAAISRVASVLEKEALLTKDARGRIVELGLDGVLRRWTDDYRVLSSNRSRSFLEPRGLPHLLEKLRHTNRRYAITGSLAASWHVRVAPARLGMVYVDEVADVGRELELHSVEAGANVILIAPSDEVVFARSTTHEGVRYAAVPQVAADLLTSPGRGPEEGEELLTWMKEHEHDWRN